jgi:hypothetical protein
MSCSCETDAEWISARDGGVVLPLEEIVFHWFETTVVCGLKRDGTLLGIVLIAEDVLCFQGIYLCHKVSVISAHDNLIQINLT